MKNKPLKEKVKRYIKENYGRFSISEIAHNYSISPVVIENYILDELSAETEEKEEVKEPVFLSKVLAWVLIFLLATLIFSINVSEMTNNDIWIHLKNGELILKNKKFLYTDTYSFRTIGMPWMNHEWLAGVIFYLVHLISGVNGLILFKTLLFIIMALVLLRTSVITKQEFAFFFPLIVFVQYNVTVRSLVRPHIFTYLFVTLYIYILFAYKYQKKDFLWSIPVLHLLWVNIHGGWFVGSVLLFVFATGETFRLLLNRFVSFWQKDLISWSRQKKLYIVILVAYMVIIFNPTGIKTYTYPLELTTQSTFMSQIYEWQPPFESPTFKKSYAFIYYIIWMGLLAISFLVAFKYFDFTNLGISMLFLYMSLRMHRNITFFTLATMPIIGINYTRFFKRIFGFKEHLWSKIDLYGKLLFLVIIVIFIHHGFTYGYRYRSGSGKAFGFGIGDNMPTKAVAYAKARGLKGKCFNPYTYGAMIINKLYPDTRVVMDSRDLPYGEKLYLEHQYAMIDVNYFAQMDKRYHFDYLMFDYTRDNLLNHFEYLEKNKNEWALIYFNEKSIIYARRKPEFELIIKEDEYHCLHPVLTFKNEKLKVKHIECLLNESLRSLSMNNQIHNVRLLWQNISLNLKRYDDAIKEAEVLTQIWPYDYRLFTFLGHLYILKEDTQKARTTLKKALSLNPRYEKAMELLNQISLE
ncbi:MAG: tetratricopeptide repeat protein [bacterium]